MMHTRSAFSMDTQTRQKCSIPGSHHSTHAVSDYFSKLRRKTSSLGIP